MVSPNTPSDALAEAFAEVLDLQSTWSSSNTPEMQRRGRLVRHTIPTALHEILTAAPPGFDWSVEGRDGTGLKTRVPWARIYSRTEAPSATGGWYVVLLFAFDGGSVSLSLNQGTTIPGTFRQRPAEELATRVERARAMLTEAAAPVDGLATEIDLADTGELGKGYERGNVFAVSYNRNELDRVRGQFFIDLLRMLRLLQLLYESETPSTSGVERPATDGRRPSLSNVPALVDSIRRSYQPETLVSSRASAELAAREMLDRLAGEMTVEQAVELAEYFNSGDWNGVPKRNRFLPAFAGVAITRVIEPLDAFNSWIRRLWRADENDALDLVDTILREPGTFPGAGRSLPTMLMYLRNPEKYVIWLQITHRGLVALDRIDESGGRTGGLPRYLRYCEAAQDFAHDFDLAPQEIDAVLAEVARIAKGEATTAMDEWRAITEDADEPGGQDEGTEPVPYPLTEVAARTQLPIENLEEWVDLLRGPKKQALFYGPPGTGKSFVAQHLARHLATPDGEVEFAQFHPAFSYEDFVEGLRPVTRNDSAFAYEVRPGLFKTFCERARTKTGTCVLILDELNRAEVAAVLGEALFLLEYRDRSAVLPYSQARFSVPPNVVVLATMNTADRSLALVDFALRRRFHAIEMRPDGDVLRQHLAGRSEEGELAIRFYDLVQQKVDNPDFAPGHTYWMSDDVSPAGLSRMWRYELRPYLQEFWQESQGLLADLDRTVDRLLSEEA